VGFPEEGASNNRTVFRVMAHAVHSFTVVSGK